MLASLPFRLLELKGFRPFPLGLERGGGSGWGSGSRDWESSDAVEGCDLLHLLDLPLHGLSVSLQLPLGVPQPLQVSLVLLLPALKTLPLLLQLLLLLLHLLLLQSPSLSSSCFSLLSHSLSLLLFSSLAHFLSLFLQTALLLLFDQRASGPGGGRDEEEEEELRAKRWSSMK
ncbi:hypothetical protein F7725_025890, partial [Dissostichus mawsoni]